jgi:phospho-N-acetylmuramoyl-pentapeptide-transferase
MEGTTMLPDLLVPLSDHFQPFNLFRYITFRTGGATITALLIALICGPAFIRWLKTHQTAGQPIRDDGPQSHLLTKIGTPTMGGLLILIAFAISTLLWMPLSNPYLWPVLLISLSFGAIGSLDDWMKLRKRSHNGMSARMKMLLQLVIAFFHHSDFHRIIARTASLWCCRSIFQRHAARHGDVLCAFCDDGYRWRVKRG